MNQKMPQYLIKLYARFKQPRYQMVPSEEPTEETILFTSDNQSTTRLLFREIVSSTDNNEPKPHLTKRQLELKDLYNRICEKKESERLQREEQAQKARLKKITDKYIQSEINQIEKMCEEIRQSSIIENAVDGRTPPETPSPPPTQPTTQFRVPTRREVGNFTRNLLKPITDNISKEI